MKVHVLSDPHFGRDMTRFSDLWFGHEDRIKKAWAAGVANTDVVLVPGDVSWAVTTKTVEKHLEWFSKLPGRVVLSPGNHDRWWKKTERLRYDGVRFLNDTFMPLGDEWTIAATTGFECPESPWWRPEMQPHFEEAQKRLDFTLALATRSRPNTKILLMIHYPPRWDRSRSPTEYEKIIARYPVELVVYGHIHGPDLVYAHNGPFDIGGRTVRYENGSADHVLFTPRCVLELPPMALLF